MIKILAKHVYKLNRLIMCPDVLYDSFKYEKLIKIRDDKRKKLYALQENIGNNKK